MTLRRGNRLSITPVTPAEWKIVDKLAAKERKATSPREIKAGRCRFAAAARQKTAEPYGPAVVTIAALKRDFCRPFPRRRCCARRESAAGCAAVGCSMPFCTSVLVHVDPSLIAPVAMPACSTRLKIVRRIFGQLAAIGDEVVSSAALDRVVVRRERRIALLDRQPRIAGRQARRPSSSGTGCIWPEPSQPSFARAPDAQRPARYRSRAARSRRAGGRRRCRCRRHRSSARSVG